MRGFRAKDSDRERYVDLIEAAYADGQLGDADRELRVGRALSAETLDELETLTRDLQRPPGAPAPAVHQVVGPARQTRTRWVGGVAVGLVAFVALVVAGVTAVVALAMFAVSGETGVDSSRAIDSPVVVETETGTETGTGTGTTPPFRLSAGSVRSFVKAYQEEFGTLEAYEVGFFAQRVGVQVPVRGSRPRMERWSWDGAWRQDTQASAVIGPNQRVDLGAVDVRRLFANIATARTTLDVEKGRFTHALLIRWGDEPTELNIYVGNDFDETGYLSTTPAGEITRRHPYAP
ncbi:DUF1707 domain-containing protein [Nocardioides oleivorans]|uniref:DUF1707 domain-containing protein n=1 Tax=Nocardioides oleivorans TaxID=273676 RepID=A0A4Q2RYI0_9ACTN|nr:DUF1707 domain-containing protein [Nocardioides oleivorans]RYB92999.1 DUF1707 domain-containing protein [Nocardioides oleivorans]